MQIYSFFWRAEVFQESKELALKLIALRRLRDSPILILPLPDLTLLDAAQLEIGGRVCSLGIRFGSSFLHFQDRQVYLAPSAAWVTPLLEKADKTDVLMEFDQDKQELLRTQAFLSDKHRRKQLTGQAICTTSKEGMPCSAGVRYISVVLARMPIDT
jgi:hypothetical protein